jgi:hypothetical protein
MAKMSSTMLSVGTLLRRAEETGAEVRVLVQGTWLSGRVVGNDGMGAVLDDGEDQQALVRLESVAAVMFSRARMDDDVATDDVWRHSHQQREPIEAGPVTSGFSVPAQPAGDHDLVTAGLR